MLIQMISLAEEKMLCTLCTVGQRVIDGSHDVE